MSKQTLEESEKHHHTYQEEYNDEDLNENYDIESEKDKIVEYSPKQRFVRFNDSLGSGAYKTVYKAYDNETGWEVAWNVIKLQRLPDKERKRISDEIALLKQLKHRNIIHFINAWINRQKEEVVFITEVVTGGSLKKYLKKIRVPRLKIIKSWCREILLGIQYLHQIEPHPIIHRDIKCDNIFINSNNGEIRIGDLGLATFMSHAYADSVLGTPEFMAPEMYEEVYGPSVDIYSFGMCVLEMSTNQTPYSECMNPAQIYKKVSQGIKPNALNLIANEQVKNFIIECLKPKDERPTASDLLESEFLNTVDPELDNQPVQLYEAPLMPKIEEEDLAKETTKSSLRVEELKHEEDFISETQSEGVKHPHHQEEEKPVLPRQTEEHLMYELKKKAASEKTPSEIQTEKINHSNFKIMNKQKSQEFQEIKPVKVEESKFSGHQEGEHSVKKSYGSQEPSTEPGFEDKRKLEAQEIERLKQERRQMEKTMVKTYSQTSLNKEVNNRYTFISKGIVNNNLTVLIKCENPNPQFDPLVEIPKEKIKPEKIKRKLFKKLELSNQNDPFFNQQMNALFDALCAQNIIQGPIINYQLSWGARSITNESQKSPDRSVLTTNPNSVFFQSAYFYKCYKKYMSKVPKEYLMQESDEVMNLRHQREIMELENFHLAQKRNMWDRRQGVMSNSVAGSNHNGYQTTTADPDDYYHKVFQFQDVSYKSDNKKKSRCTDMSISSVDSVTLSPTCSSGNNIQSISNWADVNPANFKREETPTNTLDDLQKLPIHFVDAAQDNEKHTTSNQALDTTPKEQQTGQQYPGSGNGATHKPSPASATTSSKHGVSNFAAQSGKATNNKIQQNLNLERKTPEIQEKVQEQPTAGKRLSIEKHLESGQKLTQAIMATHTQSPQTTTIAKQQQNEIEKQGDVRKDVKPPLINTNISASPPEKGSNYSQPILETGQYTPQTKIQPTSQSQPVIRQPETPIVGQTQVNNGTFSQSALLHHHQADHHHAQSNLSNLTVPKNVMQNQAWPNQPHSATIKNSQPLLNQPPNQSASGGGLSKPQGNQGNPVLNPNVSKTSLPSHNSFGSLQQTKTAPSSGGSFKTPKNSTEVPKVNSFMNSNEMSQSTYKKLQSTELLEKIKAYKIKGPLKRYTDMDLEDVKMLQTLLELLTENDILSNGHLSHYTENLIKSCQESLGVPSDGIVDELVWEKMQNALERKVERKRQAREARNKETNDLNKDVDDIKKKMKDKQNKEASECLTKIESNLLNLSDLK